MQFSEESDASLSIKLIECIASAATADLRIIAIDFITGLIIKDSTLFSLKGSPNDTLNINNVVVNDTSTIGAATILDQVGQVIKNMIVNNLALTSAKMDETLGTAILFKFTCSCKAIDFLNLGMDRISATGSLTRT